MSFVPVRLKRGKLIHAVSEGADSLTTTFCGRPAKAAVMAETKVVECAGCRSWIERARLRR